MAGMRAEQRSAERVTRTFLAVALKKLIFERKSRQGVKIHKNPEIGTDPASFDSVNGGLSAEKL